MIELTLDQKRSLAISEFSRLTSLVSRAIEEKKTLDEIITFLIVNPGISEDRSMIVPGKRYLSAKYGISLELDERETKEGKRISPKFCWQMDPYTPAVKVDE